MDKTTKLDQERELLVALGANIARRRKKLGYSQLRLALAVGVSKSYLCDVEHGRRNVSVALIARICRQLGVSMRDMCAGIGPKKLTIRKKRGSKATS